MNPAALTVGGVPAAVAFTGLTPESVGLYQVNAPIPDGVAPGDAVELRLTVAGQYSAPVTIAVQ